MWYTIGTAFMFMLAALRSKYMPTAASSLAMISLPLLHCTSQYVIYLEARKLTTVILPTFNPLMSVLLLFVFLLVGMVILLQQLTVLPSRLKMFGRSYYLIFPIRVCRLTCLVPSHFRALRFFHNVTCLS